MLQGFNIEDYNTSQVLVETSIRVMKENTKILVGLTLNKQLVGSLRYLCNIKPDITYGVGLVSKYIGNPKHSYYLVAKNDFEIC